MPDKPDLMTALRNADAAGDTEAATRIAAMIKNQGTGGGDQISTKITDQIVKTEDGSVTDIFTGADRMTPELEAMSSIGAAPEFNEFSLAALKASLGTFTTGDPEEIKAILKKQYGDRVSFSQDSKGNNIVNFKSGSYALNKPGLSLQEIPKFFGDLLAFSPAGKAKTIGGAIVKSALGEGVLESIDVSLGGEFGGEDVAISSVFGGVFKGAENIVGKLYRSLKGVSDDIPNAKEVFKENATDEALESISETIKKGTNDDLAKLVDADPKFYQAADELGISTEPVAGFASKNPQYVTLESSLASVPTSQLDDQSKAFIRETSKKADDLIEQYGGTLDKGQLNLDFKRKATEVIDDLGQQADDVYSSLTKVLPKSGRYAAPKTIAFIKSKIKEFGGFEELPSKLKRIFNKLNSKTQIVKGPKVINPLTGKVSFRGALYLRKSETIHPTLGNIDQIRKEIGQAINKKSGPFKDTEQGLLKALYARLRTDQDAIAKGAGFQKISKTADGLIIQRKQLEDNLKTLLGKDLNKALSINVAGALKGLAKGDVTRFIQVMNAIPKNQRGEVVLTAMNDVFKGSGVNQQSLSTNQFVKWYESINRSPAVKSRLFKALPKGSAQAINNLYIVSKGIEKSMGQRIHTGRLNAMFNEETGFLRRLVGRVAPSVVAVSTGSPTASAMTSSVMEFLKQSTNGAKRASDLLSSTEFRELIKRSVSAGVMSANAASLRAEKQLIKKSVFKKWRESLNKKQKEELKDLGLVKYLFAITDREGNQE